MQNWLNQLKEAKKSSIIDNTLKKVHYELKDGRELVEEYNLETNVVSRRAWRRKDRMGNQHEWEIELGDPEPCFQSDGQIIIKENASEPTISRRNTRKNLEWRIRNLSYPIDTYSVTVDQEKKCITVRTSNKKYFKNLSIPELDRLGICPKQENISYSHKYNTLIITCEKPKELVELDKAVIEMVKEVQPKPQALYKDYY